MNIKIPAEHAIRIAMNTASELGDAINYLSAINVVKVPDDWWIGRGKILMVGQETYGETRSLKNMIASEDGVAEVAESYETFDFAENTRVRGTPFWRAHRRLADEFEGGAYRQVMWSNLVEVQSTTDHGTSLHALPAEHRAKVVEWQAPIVREEFATMRPSAAVFFTGPNYDWILRRVFPGIEFDGIKPELTTSKLARLRHPALPEKSVRTYHPAYLQRSGQTALLDDVIAFLSAETSKPS